MPAAERIAAAGILYLVCVIQKRRDLAVEKVLSSFAAAPCLSCAISWFDTKDRKDCRLPVFRQHDPAWLVLDDNQVVVDAFAQ